MDLVTIVISTDYITDTGEPPTRSALLHTHRQSSSSYLHQVSPSRVNFPHQEGVAAVSMEAAQEDGDVDIDDVSTEERPVVRDAVADHVVHGGADRLGEVSVVEGGGIGASLEGHPGDQLVDLIRGDAGGGEPAGLTEDPPGQPAGLPQPLNVLGGVDCGLAMAWCWDSSQVIVRRPHVLWDTPP